MKKTMIIVLGAAVLACGCGQAPAPSQNASATPAAVSTPGAVSTPESTEKAVESVEFSAEVMAKADEILAAREKGKIPYKQLSVKENGPAFIYMATTSDDPAVVAEALQGMEKTYRSDKESEKMNLAGADYDAAIAKNLESKDNAVLFQALRAASKALGEEPSPEVTNLLIGIAKEHKEVGARMEAVDALYHVKKYEADPEIMEVFVKALGDDAPIASTALFRRNRGWTKSEQADQVKPILEGLLTHADPGVRGRAINALGGFYTSEPDYVISKAEPMLKDKSAFVRSSAIKSLGMVKTPQAIHLMMTMVDDSEKNTYDIKIQNLLGKNETVHHDGSAWSRVDDAALYNIKSATYMLGEGKRFDYGKIDYKKVDEDIANEVKKVKAWYQGYKKRIHLTKRVEIRNS